MSTLPILYSRTSKGAINTWRVWTEGNKICTEWGQVGGKLQQSTFECSPKNVGKSNATTAEEQAELEAESLHSKQKRKKYSETLEQAKNDEEIRPMLAQDFAKHKTKLVYPVQCQRKYDGLRCLSYKKAGKVVLHSRGNKFYTVPHIQDCLDNVLTPGMVLDGELYLHGTSLQTINSWVRGKKPEVSQIQYHVYDMVSDRGFADRSNDLHALLDEVPLPVVCSPTYQCDSEDEVIKCQSMFVEDGYEGAIVRTSTGKYRYGYRSPDLLKVKTWLDGEFKIVGYQVGKGKFQNVPTFRCITSEGKEFDVTPKGTEEERLELLQNAEFLVGKLLTVKYFQLSPDEQIPLYPVGLAIRIEQDLP